MSKLLNVMGTEKLATLLLDELNDLNIGDADRQEIADRSLHCLGKIAGRRWIEWLIMK
jgi:hypothetical protein